MNSHRIHVRLIRFPSLFFTAILLITSTGCLNAQEKTRFTFEVSFSANAHNQPVTGRVYAIISRKQDREPRFQTGYTGVPIWGKNVTDLKPNEGAVIDDSVFGYPIESIREIPPGEYYVQGFINIYTEFKRSDGHTIWLHNDQWEGQRWNRSPGNLYSDVEKVRIDPSEPQTIRLVCKNVIPAVKIPPDTKWVKRIKFQSKILTAFWGQPIYLGATVLLPKGYDDHPDVSYPVNYIQGHFSLGAPHGFRETNSDESSQRRRPQNNFYEYWTSDSCPRMIAVTFQHPCPYYDDSYAVNTPNVGPYGDAIMEELIPKIEETFRIIRKPYARVLSGGSTGGWESLALQVFHPDYFGGTWTGCPDPVDFRRFQLQNIYKDENMYYRVHEWLKLDIPETRSTDGDVIYTMKMRLHYENVIGDKNRSGEQWAIWEALYTPVGEDGYPKPLWNWHTGEIDHDVAEHWKQYDLSLYLRSNWSWLGPKLVGKLNLYVGDMDNAYLNLGVVLLEKFLENTKDPYYDGVVEYGDGGGHCWMPRGAELLKLFEEHISGHAPKGEDTSRWKY
ncbi:MAG: alpha/beta hydrolase-fold protein [bacterium]